jgi:hypothetical protein
VSAYVYEFFIYIIVAKILKDDYVYMLRIKLDRTFQIKDGKKDD